MLYEFLRPIARFAFRCYFREIHFSGKENIASDKPVLFISNHPTAFIEPCLLACFQSRKLHFMVRGDVFATPFYSALLRDLYMIPIYRFKDGFSNIRQNQQYMQEAIDTLGKGRVLHILAEGRTRQMKHLEPLQKGAGRIALGTMEKYPDLDLEIVPIGINYTRPDRMRRKVMISAAAPVSMQQMRHLIEEHPRKALRQITERVYEELKGEMVHIDPKEEEPWIEGLLTIARNQYWRPAFSRLTSSREALAREQAVVERIGELPLPQRQALQSKTEAYQQQLQKRQLEDWPLSQPPFPGIHHWLWLIAGFPLYAVGWLVHALPTLMSDRIVRKSVRQKEFVESVRLGLLVGSYLVYFPLTQIIACLIFGWQGLWWAPLFWASGLLALGYQGLLEKWNQWRRWQNLPIPDRKNLSNQRTHLWDRILSQ